MTHVDWVLRHGEVWRLGTLQRLIGRLSPVNRRRISMIARVDDEEEADL